MSVTSGHLCVCLYVFGLPWKQRGFREWEWKVSHFAAVSSHPSLVRGLCSVSGRAPRWAHHWDWGDGCQRWPHVPPPRYPDPRCLRKNLEYWSTVCAQDFSCLFKLCNMENDGILEGMDTLVFYFCVCSLSAFRLWNLRNSRVKKTWLENDQFIENKWK